MKTFRDHLKEEVKIGALASGGIDIEREAIRDEINGILSAIAARPCVTPYASLNKVRKALSYFSIFLPKRVYLEGRHGIEVWEINQFGHKMGVTDQGEWIHHVPAKFYLFFHYHRMGGMYYLEAKIVDDTELEKKINAAESMIAEEMDAAMRQDLAKAKAPKEDPHTALGDCDCSQGDSPSTKKAVKVSMKKIDEAAKKEKPHWEKYPIYTATGRYKPPQSVIDKYHPEHSKKKTSQSDKTKMKDVKEGWVAVSRNGPVYDKFGDANPNAKFYGRKRPVNKPGDAEPGAGDTYKGSKQGSSKPRYAKTVKEAKGPCWKGYEMIGMKKKGGREVPNCVPVKEEEQIDEMNRGGVRTGAPVVKTTRQERMALYDKQPKRLRDIEKSAFASINIPSNMSSKEAKRQIEIVRRKSSEATYGKDYPSDIPPVRSEETQVDETKKVQGYQNWPGEKKKKFFQGPKDKSGKTETQKWAERKQKEREAKQIDEISKALTKRYVKGAKADIADLNSATGSLNKFHAMTKTPKRRKEIEDQFAKNMQKVDRRKSGIEKAKSRLKEEQIDELKKSTVASYEKKAGKQLDKIMDKATDPYLSNLSAAERKTANKRGAGLKMAADRLEEKAPPGAKFERMVKHIKAGYAKDGLTKKEKGIAYATAWKAKKRESED